MTADTNEPFHHIQAPQAAELIARGDVTVVDVRTPAEFEQLGHIPGATLLPVDLIASGAAALTDSTKPLLIVCEHGIRSVHAARFLAAAGFSNLRNLEGGMATWMGERDYHARSSATSIGPASWLLETADLLPAGGDLLDVACGRGRHALLLAAAGFCVRAVDRDTGKIEALQRLARRLQFPLTAVVDDLETDDKDLGTDVFDVLLAIHYLHRPLFPAIIRALRPGGLLIYETFTVEQSKRGKPTNPNFLLMPGELPELVRPLSVVRQREGDFDSRMIASIAARKTG